MAKTDSSHVDMLSGNIWRNMILFALPLIASGVLQQSFNSVDIAVVGRFAGHKALAAVGSNGSVISLIVNLFIGLSVGANVLLANYIGRNNDAGIRRTVATTAALALVSGVILLIVSQVVASPLLHALGTPDEVLGEATLYLRIFSIGMPFMMVFNFGAALLRSYGDTRRPFYALVSGGVVNVVLNLLFVIVFHMGVAGVAIATVIANVVSAAIILQVMRRESEPYRLHFGKMKFERGELAKILRIGVPAGVQGMVFSFSNVFIQSAINAYGTNAVAGSAAALNYESYSYFVIVAFAQSVMAFTGQNFGAGNLRRCVKVLWVGMAWSVVASGLINLAVAIFDRQAISVFTTDEGVMQFAITRIHMVLAFQFIACSYEIAGASLRGQGYSLAPTLITIAGTCVLRLGWVFMSRDADWSFARLLVIYPITWVVTGTAMIVFRLIIARHLENIQHKRSIC